MLMTPPLSRFTQISLPIESIPPNVHTHISFHHLMPQSLSQVIVHIVFSTKDRYRWLDDTIASRMHAYLATICRDCSSEAYRVGGVADHVHLAVRLGRTVTQAQLIEKMKTASSSWIKKQKDTYQRFHWQRGYGAFSIGFSQLETLIEYIDTQAEHHRARTFQEEYRQFLRKYRIPFDEHYVWD
jgi:REP element-mobilizing transposase RayT